MTADTVVLAALYGNFNARNIDAVLEWLTADATWANGMEGGHVQGHDAVLAYWTRPWSVVRAHVEPLGFDVGPDGAVVVRVRQTILDLEGKPLVGHEHGLDDRTLEHVFRFRDGKVARFDIGETV